MIRTAILLFLALLAFHVLGSWSLPLIDRDEPRFAEAAREMIEGDDYVIPRFNGEYRFDKPPLIYWLQVACYRAFGENDFSARLPSAVAAAGVSLLVFLFGCRFLDREHSLAAALLFEVCIQTFLHGKAAVADMVMIFFMTGAVFTGWALLDPAKERRPTARTLYLWTLLGILLGAGFLTKGPVAWLPVLPLAACGAMAGKGAKFHFGWIYALVVVAAGTVLLWAYPALLRTGGEYFKIGIGKHVVDRSFNVMEDHGLGGPGGYIATLPFYALTIFVSFFPGSIFLPWLARRVWKRETRGLLHAYLLGNFLAIFLVFTFVSTKLPHYVLPGFPFLALVLMMHWKDAGRPLQPVRKWIAGTAAALALMALILPPFAVRLFPSHQFLQASRDDLSPEMEFASTGYEEPSLVWYFRGHVDGFHKKQKISRIADYLRRDGPRFAIVPTDKLDEIEGFDPDRYIIHRHAGLNIAKTESVDLTMIIKK